MNLINVQKIILNNNNISNLSDSNNSSSSDAHSRIKSK